MLRDRSRTLTALIGVEPLAQAQAAEVQRPQFFLSKASWNADAITAQRLKLLMQPEDSASSASGVLVIDGTDDCKEGHATGHVSRQYLASVGETDNSIVAVTSLWLINGSAVPCMLRPTRRPRVCPGQAGSDVSHQTAHRPGIGRKGQEFAFVRRPPDMKKPDKQDRKNSLGFRDAVLNL